MNRLFRTFAALCAAFILAVGSPAAWAHGKGGSPSEEAPGHSHEASSVHGGEVTMTREFHFEVVPAADALQVYVYDARQRPLSARGITGKVSVRFHEAKRKSVTARLAFQDDGSYGLLAAPLRLKDAGEAKITIELSGLPGRAEKKVRFTQTLTASGGHDHGH